MLGLDGFCPIAGVNAHPAMLAMTILLLIFGCLIYFLVLLDFFFIAFFFSKNLYEVCGYKLT